MNNLHEPDQRECKELDEYFTVDFVKKIGRICFNTAIGKGQYIQEEVTSKTLLQLWEHRQEIDFSTGKVGAYAKTIANRILIDIIKREKIVEFQPAEKMPESSELPTADYESLLEDIMKCISDDIDKIIIQKKIEGYKTAKDIVPFLKDFGINDPSAVTKRLKKLEDRIKKLIQQGE